MNIKQQIHLLRLEYDYVKAEFQRSNDFIGIGRKIKRGECWYPVETGRSYYNSLNEFALELTRTTDCEIEHLFEYGRSVCFFKIHDDGTIQYYPFSATVNSATESKLVVCLPDVASCGDIQSTRHLGVMLNFDEQSFHCMFNALDKVTSAKDNRLAYLRDIFHGTTQPSFSKASANSLSFPWLNKSQEKAVNDVIAAHDVLIVHGPPGTGKTTTLIEAINEVLRREPQVLVCAQSNNAVDWISEQLANRGISILRIGNPARVTDKMLQNTYEKRFEAHPDYPMLWKIRRDIRSMLATPKAAREASHHQKISRLKEKAEEIELRIRQSLFDNSRVIASTLVGSANKLLIGQHFNTLFIDEAAQALEAACWIAIEKANRVIFAGDHCQLPPTIKSPEALRGGLGQTLMETIAQNKPSVVRLLDVQYRMNEQLMQFSSNWFYEGRLKAAPEVKYRTLYDDFDSPLIWKKTTLADNTNGDSDEDFHETFVGLSYGRVNRGEAKLTIQTLCNFVESMGRQRMIDERIDFGIISPYRAQVQYLRTLLKHNQYLRPLRGQISINTVDAFQGQERDVILVSLVRANDNGNIGFLSDLRRMNVAMTRARMKLIIIGSPETLCKHDFYKKLYEACTIIN